MTDSKTSIKKPRGRPSLAVGDKREYIRLCLEPDVKKALKATGNASRTIDELVRRYLMTGELEAS